MIQKTSITPKPCMIQNKEGTAPKFTSYSRTIGMIPHLVKFMTPPENMHACFSLYFNENHAQMIPSRHGDKLHPYFLLFLTGQLCREVTRQAARRSGHSCGQKHSSERSQSSQELQLQWFYFRHKKPKLFTCCRHFNNCDINCLVL